MSVIFPESVFARSVFAHSEKQNHEITDHDSLRNAFSAVLKTFLTT